MAVLLSIVRPTLALFAADDDDGDDYDEDDYDDDDGDGDSCSSASLFCCGLETILSQGKRRMSPWYSQRDEDDGGGAINPPSYIRRAISNKAAPRRGITRHLSARRLMGLCLGCCIL